MTQESPPTLPALAPRGPAFSVSPAVCGRVLLYVRGMEIDPILGLELALRSVRRAAAGAAERRPDCGTGEAPVPDEPPAPDEAPDSDNPPAPDDSPAPSEAHASDGPPAEASLIPAAMRELHRLLRERAIDFRVADRDGQDLRSAPPMRRSAMIPEEMDIAPLRSALRKFFRKLSGSVPDKGRDRSR
jgi:hypothetical protein